MQVSVEKTEGLGRRMTVSIPDERISSKVQKRLQQMSRTASLKGFRPGKVPMKVLEQRYGVGVRQEVIGEVMQSSFYEAVTQEKLQPAGSPKIEPVSMEKGKDVEYTATFEVMPEVELADLSGIKLEKIKAEVTDADLDKMMENLRKQRTAWKEVERKAKDGDRVTIDFAGTIDGESFKGGSGENLPVTLGSGSMIEGFEDGLLGAKPGDELTLDLKFPEDYANKEVAGKDVQFAVKVTKVEEAELPEMDDEFAKSFGVEEGGMEKLREEVRGNMQHEMESHLNAEFKNQVMDKLLEANPVEVPQALIEHEAETMANHMRQQMYTPSGKSGVNIEASMFEEQAKRRVSLGMIVSEVIDKNNLEVDDERVRSEVERMAAGYEKPEEVVNWYYGDPNRLAEVRSLALENLVVEWIAEQAQIEEVGKNFDEIMNQG